MLRKMTMAEAILDLLEHRTAKEVRADLERCEARGDVTRAALCREALKKKGLER